MQNIEKSLNPDANNEESLDPEFVRRGILNLSPKDMEILEQALKEEESDITIEQACKPDFFAGLDQRHLGSINSYRRTLVFAVAPEEKKEAALDLADYLLNV